MCSRWNDNQKTPQIKRNQIDGHQLDLAINLTPQINRNQINGRKTADMRARNQTSYKKSNIHVLSLFVVSIDIGGPNIASKLKKQSNTHRIQIQIEGFFWPAAID